MKNTKNPAATVRQTAANTANFFQASEYSRRRKKAATKEATPTNNKERPVNTTPAITINSHAVS